MPPYRDEEPTGTGVVASAEGPAPSDVWIGQSGNAETFVSERGERATHSLHAATDDKVVT